MKSILNDHDVIDDADWDSDWMIVIKIWKCDHCDWDDSGMMR